MTALARAISISEPRAIATPSRLWPEISGFPKRRRLVSGWERATSKLLYLICRESPPATSAAEAEGPW